MTLGATYLGQERCLFRVWAPYRKQAAVRLLESPGRPWPLTRDDRGYWSGEISPVKPGALYELVLDGQETYPDPASAWQPQGVFGPSAVVDHDFAWTDQAWCNPPLKDYIIYECHIGTFSAQGTFQSALTNLPYLKDLGITAIELMPVAAFSGRYNWGYDVVFPFAVHQDYGGPQGLKTFINACHQHGLAVILDVIYNHFGPEGNILEAFGPYFTAKYPSFWGKAVNFDDQDAQGARNLVKENALYWARHFHVDGLRLDAVQAIFDQSAYPILAEVKDALAQFSTQQQRPVHVIAESDLNASIITSPKQEGGWGLDAAWCDDHHHAWHAFLTGEHSGYYQDFGAWDQVKATLAQGFWFQGQFCQHRQKHLGDFVHPMNPRQLVIYVQNHDMVGNRLQGERLSTLVAWPWLYVLAAATLLSPFVPLLFMGEEYGETNPFLFFVDHASPLLRQAVRAGRRKELGPFNWKGEPPDPYAQETFERSKLDWSKLTRSGHEGLYRFYKQLISLRKQFRLQELNNQQDRQILSCATGPVVSVVQEGPAGPLAMVINAGADEVTWSVPWPQGIWEKVLDSHDFDGGRRSSLLPNRMEASTELTWPAASVAVYTKREHP